MSKWIVALLVGLLSINCVLGSEGGSFLEDFNDDMGLEIGSFESEQISLESEDVSRRTLGGGINTKYSYMLANVLDENSVIKTFDIPNEPLVPIAESVLPARKEPLSEQSALFSQPILSVPLEQQPSVAQSEQPASLVLKPVPSLVQSAQLEALSIPSVVQSVPLVSAEQPLSIPIGQPGQTPKPAQIPQSARAKPSSNVLFSMEVSKALEGAPSLQQEIEAAVEDDEEEGTVEDDGEAISGEDDSEGGVTDEEEGSFEEITYSRPRASFSQDSQSDSSDAEWYALIHSRRPKDNNQPPPVTNIPSSHQNRHRDDRYDGRRERRGNRRADRNREDQRARGDRDEVQGEHSERWARYDPAEALGGPYFIPVKDLKQREAHRMKMRGQHVPSGGSSSNSQDSYSSSGSADEGRRHRRHGHKSGPHARRRPGYFEGLVRKIPRKVTDL